MAHSLRLVHQSPPPDRDPIDLAWQTLRPPLSSFIGREQEIATVVGLLRQEGVRLVTLTGPGGVGKTRLALRVAKEIAGDYSHGFEIIDLSPLRDPGLVLRVIAQALGTRAQTSLLLVLDNFEHVIDAAPRITDLVTACPRITVLLTSRERLRIDAEHVFPVPPLSLPGGEGVPDPAGSAAIALFVERARAVAPDLAASRDDVAVIAEICRRLDGLPLAIELAAARAGVLPPQILLEQLERRLPLLNAGARDAPARHQTMRAAIAWSYDLLRPEEQALFRALSVFIGGFTVEVAEWVMRDGSGSPEQAALPAIDTFDGILRLADKHLVQYGTGSNDSARFSQLETIREFGLDRLSECGEADEVRNRQASWCLHLAE